MELSDFVVSEWFWAAAAVAVAVAALIGSVATFIGGAIIRRVNRPEPEWDIRFEKPQAVTDLRRTVGNRVTGRITNIGDGTAFQVRISLPDGNPAKLSVGDGYVEVVPALRTGDSMDFRIVTGLDVWDKADSVLSWIAPPTRRRRGGSQVMRPHEFHAQPVPSYWTTSGGRMSREEWLTLRAAKGAGKAE